MTLAPVGLLLGSVLSFVLALAVRHAGAVRIVNLADYRHAEPAALNAAIGRRLFVLPIAFLALAGLAWTIPPAGLFAVGAAVPVVLLAAFWASAAKVPK